MGFFLHRHPLILGLLGLALFLSMFQGVPGFRDGIHFYAPLFQYLCDEIAAHRLPLWNPFENLGQPLAANPTTMLFYPGTLFALVIYATFRCEALSIYTTFVAAHFFVAMICSYRLAKEIRCSKVAATFAAICYIFGGAVLFQWNNVPFLIGAAWFPEALIYLMRIFRISPTFSAKDSLKSSLNSTAKLGIVLSLMILGGDLQAAYHVILCGIIFFVYCALSSISCLDRFRKKRLFHKFTIYVTSQKYVYVSVLCLFAAILTACLLSAIQILPAWELLHNSDRALDCHREIMYDFSLPPWKMCEFLLPNFSGRQFPINTRWFSAIPYQNGIWIPSLYMGILPICLAFLYATSMCTSPRKISPNWLFQPKNERKHGANNGDENRINDEPQNGELFDVFVPFLMCTFLFLLGGLGNWFFVYSILSQLPFYDAFRYPAKLLVPASLFVAIFAGKGFDLSFQNRIFKIRLQKMLLGYMILLAILFVINSFQLFRPLFDDIPACPLFGPFQIDQAENEIKWTLLSEFAILLFVIMFYSEFLYKIKFWSPQNRKNPENFYLTKLCPANMHISAQTTSLCLLVILFIDLTCANSWMFATVPQNVLQIPQNLLKQQFGQENKVQQNISSIAEYIINISDKYENAPICVYRFPIWYPREFLETSSPNRLVEAANWGRQTLFPRYSLPLRIRILDVRGTLMSKDYFPIAGQLRQSIVEKNGAKLEKQILELNGHFVIAPANNENISFPIPNFKKVKLPESIHDVNLLQSAFDSEKNDNATIRYKKWEPNQFTIEITCQTARRIVIQEQFDSGWHGFLNGKKIPIHSDRRLFCEIDCPAGTQELVMIYDPISLKIGGILTLFGLGIVILFMRM
ncbi:MAG: hypothetical protein ACRCUY_00470 [Thermoguttaceae bacterium]